METNFNLENTNILDNILDILEWWWDCMLPYNKYEEFFKKIKDCKNNLDIKNNFDEINDYLNLWIEELTNFDYSWFTTVWEYDINLSLEQLYKIKLELKDLLSWEEVLKIQEELSKISSYLEENKNYWVEETNNSFLNTKKAWFMFDILWPLIKKLFSKK